MLFDALRSKRWFAETKLAEYGEIIVSSLFGLGHNSTAHVDVKLELHIDFPLGAPSTSGYCGVSCVGILEVAYTGIQIPTHPTAPLFSRVPRVQYTS